VAASQDVFAAVITQPAQGLATTSLSALIGLHETLRLTQVNTSASNPPAAVPNVI
jgi:hypothetical protein